MGGAAAESLTEEGRKSARKGGEVTRACQSGSRVRPLWRRQEYGGDILQLKLKCACGCSEQATLEVMAINKTPL